MDSTPPASEVHLHHSYRTRPVALSAEDSDDMHSLAVAVNWPHRPQDMDMLLSIGQGLIARDEIGRALGAGMTIFHDEGAAMIGMMMTHPKLQAGGLGAAILSQLEAMTHGRNLRLNATRAAWKLYRSAGFTETGTVAQYQGVASPADTPLPEQVRPIRPDETGALFALDRDVFGCARPAALKAILAISDTQVLVQNDQITGFACCRLFGRGHLIGPLVAPDDLSALHLIQGFLRQHKGRFLRLDADVRHTDLAQGLAQVGLAKYDSVIPMTKGTPFGPENRPGHVYALASQAMG